MECCNNRKEEKDDERKLSQVAMMKATHWNNGPLILFSLSSTRDSPRPFRNFK